MAPERRTLAIDARPFGPRGTVARERVGGLSMLARTLELAAPLSDDPIPVLLHDADRDWADDEIASIRPELKNRYYFQTSLTSEAPTLRTDRLYNRRRVRRALRTGNDLETAVIWRLDRPEGLAGAEDELRRRQTYQPLGRFWALAPARALARGLAPTRIRPNQVTTAAAACLLAASAAVAFGPRSRWWDLGVALAIAAGLVLDTADGHLARLQGTTSEFGRWLDAWLDEICDMTLHAAIAWAGFIRSGQPGWLLLGMLYGMSKYVFLVGQTSVARPVADSPVVVQTVGASILRETIRMIGHADIRLHVWIALAALGRLDLALVAYSLYFPIRALLGLASRVKEVRHA